MKKFILSVLAFGLIAAVTYVPLLFLSGEVLPYWVYSNLKYTGGHSHTPLMLSEAKRTANPDVVFFGSSHAYRGFDVRILHKNGYTALNMGTSSQTPIQADILAARYLKQINPSMVIYEVYPNLFGAEGAEGTTDLLSNDRIDSLSINMATEINDLATYNTLLFGFYKNRNGLTLPPSEIRLSKGDHYTPGGFIARDISYYRNDAVTYNTKIKINEKQLQHFEAFINRLKAQHIPYALVMAPMPKSTYKGYTNIKEFNSLMAGYGPYYNYNGQVALNDSLHFYDEHHLNSNGAKIFTEQLLKNKAIFKPAKKD